MLLTSPILGFSCLCLLFLTCVLVTIGAKYLLSFFIKKPQPVKKPKKPQAKPTVKKSVRTIQIDPDEIDKIYVGKMH